MSMRHVAVGSMSFAAAVFSATSAQADQIFVSGNAYDVEFVAGSGSNTSIFEADFNGAGSYVFGYRWNGTATGRDQLVALQAAAQGLTFTETDFGFAFFLNTLNYDGHTPPDSYPNSFWWYYEGTNGSDWTESLLGYSGTTLTDGGFYAFALQSSDPNYPDYLEFPPLPMLNTPDAVTAVPEPASISTLGLAIVGLIARRRSQQR